MALDFNTNTKNYPEYLTPRYIVEALGYFDLDPCASIERPWPTATNHFTVVDDGFNRYWEGRVWLNPPYGKETFKWIERLAKHQSGLGLIFARTETKGFHRLIWEKAHSVFFFEGRLSFCDTKGKPYGTCNAPSCLVSYSRFDSWKIETSKLKGKQIYLGDYGKET